MTRWSKVRIVAGFEFLSTVKRVGYLVTTFGMPLFMLMYAGVISGIGFFVHEKETEVRIYGVVDPTGILRLDGDAESAAIDVPDEIRAALDLAAEQSPVGDSFAFWQNYIFRPFASVDSARQALTDSEIRGIFRIPDDYLESGRVESFAKESLQIGGSDSRAALKNLLLDRLLEGKVAADVAERVRHPIAETVRWTVTREGQIEEYHFAARILRLVVPLVFTILMFISLMMTASYLLQGTAVEKENKLAEVLLSSANPDEILSGKLLGLAAAGLLQITLWFSVVIVGGVALASSLEVAGVEVPWVGMIVAVAFFLSGYLFLGSLMLGTGSLGNNMRESQQLSVVWTLISVIPLAFMQILVFEPHGTFGRVLTWFPFTSPVTVVLRTTLDPDGISAWEIAGAFVMMLVSTWFALRIGARLFRVGLLLSGARPKFREILRQARLSI